MELTYHTRRKLRRAGLIALAAALILTVIWGCWVVWVERHIVYTRDGAVIDYALTGADPGTGQLALPPENQETVSIFYNDGTEDLVELDISLRQISGYYITADMLQNDMDTVRATVAALPVGSGVMMDVKSIKGAFYYTSNIEDAPTDSGMDITAVDQLIADIASRNLYLIASVPAFRDRHFGLEHTSCGLPFIGGGGALWLDGSGCYWLDPTDDGTLDYLTQIARELKNLGFDEVVFTDFCFPDSPEIEFTGNKVTAIQEAAGKLVEEASTDRFAVSFLATGSTVNGVAGRSRLYLTDVDAAAAAAAISGYTVEDPAVNILFLTDSYDTRYEAFSVLRPMNGVITE